MKIVIDNVSYSLITPKDEDKLEKSIQENSYHIFGKTSFYFDVKKIIRSKAGIASIPDGYAILFEPKPRWCIVEIELASHPIYDHVISQLSKFIRGIEDTQTRKNIVDLLYDAFNKDDILKAQLKKKIKTGEIYKFILDLLSEAPLIVVIIDEKTEELQEALIDLRAEIKVLEFKTFRREGVSEELNAYVFEPLVGAKIPISAQKSLRSSSRGIGRAIYALFDAKGVDNARYNECESLARSIKPNTKFNEGHFSWYKREYSKKSGKVYIKSNKDAMDIYDEKHHIEGKPNDIIELFHTFGNFCMNIAPEGIAKRYLAKYIQYNYRGNIFCSVHIYESRLCIWLKLKYNDLDNPPDCVRDVSKIGHWGNGDVEISVTNASTLEIAKTFIKKSFEENRPDLTTGGESQS